MNPIYILVLCCFAINVNLFSKDIYIPSLPDIANSLHCPDSLSGASITMFLIGTGISQLFYGPLSDHFGRKKILLTGLMICLVGNALSVYVQSIQQFILFRFIAGCGAGACSVIPRAIASDFFKDARLTKAISYISMTTVVSPALAPWLGGTLQEFFDWRACFIVLAIATFSCVIAFALFFQETHANSNTSVLSLKRIAKSNLYILSSNTFLAYSALSIIAFASGTVYFILSPFIFQGKFALTPSQNGFLYIYIAIGYFVGAFSASRLTDYFNDDTILLSGTLICIASSIVLLSKCMFTASMTTTWITVPMLANALGCGMMTPVANKQGIALFPQNAGAAAALIGSLRLFGGFMIGTQVTQPNTYTVEMLGSILLALSTIGLLIHLLCLRPIYATKPNIH